MLVVRVSYSVSESTVVLTSFESKLTEYFGRIRSLKTYQNTDVKPFVLENGQNDVLNYF